MNDPDAWSIVRAAAAVLVIAFYFLAAAGLLGRWLGGMVAG